MGLTRDHSAKWVFLLFLPFVILLLSYSSVHAQRTSITPPAVSGYWTLSGVHFTSANEGWVAGWDSENHKGVLLHYENGTWLSVSPPDVSGSWSLSGVHFIMADEGWAVGYDDEKLKGILLHYQDGIWTSVTPPFIMGPYWRLHGIHFTSPTEGWVVGWDYGNYRSALIRYRNGTWISVTPPAVKNDWDLVGVYFTSPTEGWAVGFDQYNYEGVLFHYLSLWPNKGSIGTQITIIDSGFGSEKGKVLIGNASTKIISWSDSLITAEIAKALPLGPHAVVVKPKEPKRAAPIVYNGAFTMLSPETISVDPVSGTEGAEITVSGNYFGSKKGKVYLVNPSTGKKKNYKVTSWTMNPTDGTSVIKFIVPKVDAGNYWLYVSNKVGANPPGVPYQVN